MKLFIVDNFIIILLLVVGVYLNNIFRRRKSTNCQASWADCMEAIENQKNLLIFISQASVYNKSTAIRALKTQSNSILRHLS